MIGLRDRENRQVTAAADGRRRHHVSGRRFKDTRPPLRNTLLSLTKPSCFLNNKIDFFPLFFFYTCTHVCGEISDVECFIT